MLPLAVICDVVSIGTLNLAVVVVASKSVALPTSMFIVVPLISIFVSPPVASSSIESSCIPPTFEIELSPKDKLPAKAVIVVVPIVPPFIWLPLMVSLLICPAIVSAVIEPPNAVDVPAIVIASEANLAIGISSLSISATMVAAIVSLIKEFIWAELETIPVGKVAVTFVNPLPSPLKAAALIDTLELMFPLAVMCVAVISPSMVNNELPTVSVPIATLAADASVNNKWVSPVPSTLKSPEPWPSSFTIIPLVVLPINIVNTVPTLSTIKLELSVNTPFAPTRANLFSVKLVSCNSLATIVPLELIFPLAVMCPWADALKCKLPPNCMLPTPSILATSVVSP